MKYFLALVLLFSFTQLKAQSADFEVKVVSNKYQTIVGRLIKVSVEGIGVEDYHNTYFIFRPNEISTIKVRKRGLTIWKGLGRGTLIGLGIGGGILSLDENGRFTNDMLLAAAVVIGAGVVGGTAVGTVAQLANTKLTLRVNESEERFRATYQQLQRYVNDIETDHFN